MSVVGFFLTQNSSNFFYKEGSTAWLYDGPRHLSPSYIAKKNYDKSLVTALILSCILTLSLVKPLNMLIKDHVKTTDKMLFLLTLKPAKIMSQHDNLLKNTLLYTLSPLEFKPLLAQTLLLLKMQVIFLRKNSNFLGIVFFSLNNLIKHSNFLAKLLVM